MVMSVDFATWVYLPNFDAFARSITIYPRASQPGVAGFAARGSFDTNEVDVIGMDAEIITDCRTELDIFQPEWSVYPLQGDIIDIPPESDVDGGLFEVSDVMGLGNAGGELTLRLSRFEQGRLLGYLVTTSSFAVGALSFAKPVLS